MREITTAEIIVHIENERGFTLQRSHRTQTVTMSSNSRYTERLVGPMDIRDSDIRVLLKIDEIHELAAGATAQFVVIDCEGDILNHDAEGLENYNFDLLHLN